ncbi:hypothetical protein KIL84_009050, partial [Mauremys mutica]
FHGQGCCREKDPPYVLCQQLTDANPDGSSHSTIPYPGSFHSTGGLLSYWKLLMHRETRISILGKEGNGGADNHLLVWLSILTNRFRAPTSK